MNLVNFGGGQNLFQKIGALRAKIPSRTLFLPLFRPNFGGVEKVDPKNRGVEMEDQKNGGGGEENMNPHPPQGVFGTLPNDSSSSCSWSNSNSSSCYVLDTAANYDIRSLVTVTILAGWPVAVCLYVQTPDLAAVVHRITPPHLTFSPSSQLY